MLGFAPKLPVSDQERLWVDEGFRRLEKMLGQRRMLEAKVVLPTAEDFPDPYDDSPMAAKKLCRRVCGYMRVDPSTIEIETFEDETEELRKILPHWSGNSRKCAGLFVHDQEEGGEQVARGGLMVVAINETQLKDPLVLVATVSHELGHVILLGGKLMTHKTPDHEPMTDLLTVFLGLGIFTANSAGRFRQFQEDGRQGWSMQRLGYMPEEAYGYALAKFALARGENKPKWVKHLSTNVRADFWSSMQWIRKNTPGMILENPFG